MIFVCVQKVNNASGRAETQGSAIGFKKESSENVHWNTKAVSRSPIGWEEFLRRKHFNVPSGPNRHIRVGHRRALIRELILGVTRKEISLKEGHVVQGGEGPGKGAVRDVDSLEVNGGLFDVQGR